MVHVWFRTLFFCGGLSSFLRGLFCSKSRLCTTPVPNTQTWVLLHPSIAKMFLYPNLCLDSFLLWEQMRLVACKKKYEFLVEFQGYRKSCYGKRHNSWHKHSISILSITIDSIFHALGEICQWTCTFFAWLTRNCIIKER